MRRPGAVRFHAALRASHDLGGLADVQFLPVTQEESLALTLRKGLHLFLNDFNDLRLLQPVRGRGRHARRVVGLAGLQRIRVVVLAAPGAGSTAAWSTSSAPSAAELVADARSAGCAGTAAAAPRPGGRRTSPPAAASRPARCRAPPRSSRTAKTACLKARRSRRRGTPTVPARWPGVLLVLPTWPSGSKRRLRAMRYRTGP